MFSAITFITALLFSIAFAEIIQSENQKVASVDTTWAASVLKGEKLNHLLIKDFDKKPLSGHIITPDSKLTESMPVLLPPPVDEGILIPDFKKKKNTITLPPKTE